MRELNYYRILREMQKEHNAYWIKSTRIRDKMFGKVDISIGKGIVKRENKYNRNTARARNIYEKLIKRGLVKKTKYKPSDSCECIYLHALEPGEKDGK